MKSRPVMVPVSTPKQVLKSVGPKLVPFFKTVAIYFVLFIPHDRPSWFAMGIKCLPILSLLVFVLLHGMSLGDEYSFSRRIIAGLIFSCIGDAFLIWPQYFVHGMVAFGAAQISYTSAFGFYPLNFTLGAVLYTISAIGVKIIWPGLTNIFTFVVPMYSVLLITMVWRAIARVQFFQELWTWTKLCSCIGGILFSISDGVIGLHHFYAPVPYYQVLVMTTYYAAQLGISLSVVDSMASYMSEKKSRGVQMQRTTPVTKAAH